MSRPPANPAQPSPDSNGNEDRSAAAPVGRPADGSLPKTKRPPGIKVISVVVLLEALALLTAAAWYAFELLTGAPVLTFWGAVFTLALLLAFSAWLFAVGHFLFRGYRWTRAAALVAQLFVLTIGFPTATSGLILPGLAMILPALAAILFLFQPNVISFASRTGGTEGAL